MSKENKKVSQENLKQDYATNKLLCAFTIAFVMILGVMYFRRQMRTDTWVTGMNTLKTLSIVLLVATVIFAALAIIFKIKGKDQKYKLVIPKHLAFVCGFATLCFGALSFAYSPNTVNFLYVVIAAVTVLFIVYHTYPRDFFAISLISAFGAIALWVTSTAISGGMGASKLWLIIGFELTVIVLLLAATIIVQANGGKLCRKKKCRLFEKGAKYFLIYAAYALVLALLAATWFMVGAALYHFLFILLAYFVVAGIYYTFKML